MVSNCCLTFFCLSKKLFNDSGDAGQYRFNIFRHIFWIDHLSLEGISFAAAYTFYFSAGSYSLETFFSLSSGMMSYPSAIRLESI